MAGIHSHLRRSGPKAPILEALGHLGYEKPSPIQAEVFQISAEWPRRSGYGPDGSGKTAAFSLPLLQNLDRKLKAPQILVWHRPVNL
ncbi:DEAD/DEAH box helicase [Shigella boydii]